MIIVTMETIGLSAVLAGLLLMRRVPVCQTTRDKCNAELSVIIPARNEENSLPVLLGSIQPWDPPTEVIVVDDHSTDATAKIAIDRGARLVSVPPLPGGWTGKTWACTQGALVANNTTLLFLDADTWLAPRGLERMANGTAGNWQAASILPFHITRKPFEELSLFFNLPMAFGASGFGLLGQARLFGQSLLISQHLYQACGTHEAVRSEILENLALAERVRASGARCVCLGGRGVLNMRMFPDGMQQLCQGWTKAFAAGAAKTPPAVLSVTIVWIASLCFVFLCLIFGSGHTRITAAIIYVVFAIQITWMARQIGTFRWYSCAFYPIPLLFFFALFGYSALRRTLRLPVSWRGRPV